jgi:hypothetical protein
VASSEKLLSCLFLLDVLCSYRKDAKLVVMARCFKCKEYVRFMAEMDEEDKQIMARIERIHRTGVWEE